MEAVKGQVASDENDSLQQPRARAPQHSPSPTETTCNTSTSSPHPGNFGRKHGDSKLGSNFQPSISTDNDTIIEDGQSKTHEQRQQHHPLRPSYVLATTANQSSLTASTAATSASTLAVPPLTEEVDRRQSSFSNFLAYAKVYWNDLGKETDCTRRQDSLTPHNDITLYPILPNMDDSLNDSSCNNINNHQQAARVRKQSKNTRALEAFHKSHLLKLKQWKQQDVVGDEKKLDQSSSTSHYSNERSSTSNYSQGLEASNNSSSSHNQRQQQSQRISSSARSNQPSPSSSNNNEPTIFELFEKRRQNRQQLSPTPETTNGPTTSSSPAWRLSNDLEAPLSSPPNRAPPSRVSSNTSNKSMTKFELVQQQIEQQQRERKRQKQQRLQEGSDQSQQEENDETPQQQQSRISYPVKKVPSRIPASASHYSMSRFEFYEKPQQQPLERMQQHQQQGERNRFQQNREILGKGPPSPRQRPPSRAYSNDSNTSLTKVEVFQQQSEQQQNLEEDTNMAHPSPQEREIPPLLPRISYPVRVEPPSSSQGSSKDALSHSLTRFDLYQGRSEERLAPKQRLLRAPPNRTSSNQSDHSMTKFESLQQQIELERLEGRQLKELQQENIAHPSQQVQENPPLPGISYPVREPPSSKAPSEGALHHSLARFDLDRLTTKQQIRAPPNRTSSNSSYNSMTKFELLQQQIELEQLRGRQQHQEKAQQASMQQPLAPPLPRISYPVRELSSSKAPSKDALNHSLTRLELYQRRSEERLAPNQQLRAPPKRASSNVSDLSNHSMTKFELLQQQIEEQVVAKRQGQEEGEREYAPSGSYLSQQAKDSDQSQPCSSMSPGSSQHSEAKPRLSLSNQRIASAMIAQRQLAHQQHYRQQASQPAKVLDHQLSSIASVQGTSSFGSDDSTFGREQFILRQAMTNKGGLITEEDLGGRTHQDELHFPNHIRRRDSSAVMSVHQSSSFPPMGTSSYANDESTMRREQFILRQAMAKKGGHLDQVPTANHTRRSDATGVMSIESRRSDASAMSANHVRRSDVSGAMSIESRRSNASMMSKGEEINIRRNDASGAMSIESRRSDASAMSKGEENRKNGPDLIAAHDLVDTPYPTQQEKDIYQLTSMASQGSDAAAFRLEQEILKQGFAQQQTGATRETMDSSMPDLMAPPRSQSPSKAPSTQGTPPMADATEKASNRNNNSGSKEDVQPGAYSHTPGKCSQRNRSIRNSVISQHSMSAQMSRGELFGASCPNIGFRTSLSSHTGDSSVSTMSASYSETKSGRHNRSWKGSSFQSKQGIDEAISEDVAETSAADFYEPMPDYSEKASLQRDEEEEDEKMYGRKMAPIIPLSHLFDSSSDEEEEGFARRKSNSVSPRAHRRDTAKPPPNTKYNVNISSSGSISSARAPSPPSPPIKRIVRPHRKGIQKKMSGMSHVSQISSTTEDTGTGTQPSSSDYLHGSDHEEEKEEIASLDNSGGDISTVPPLRSLPPRQQRGRSPIPTPQTTSENRSLSPPGSGSSSMNQSGIGDHHRLQPSSPVSPARAATTYRFATTRRFSNLSTYGGSAHTHQKRKLSLLSENSVSLDDSYGSTSASALSLTDLKSRVSSVGSSSIATTTTLAARQSAGRIARNMSLYMKSGALPVAATVVDGEEGALTAELREQLEVEIRKELEIEMEEFRRQVVLQVVGAAEPVTANVISVNPRQQLMVADEEQGADVEMANLQASVQERERREAAAQRANMNRELGRMFLDMRRGQSAHFSRYFGASAGVDNSEDHLVELFNDEEIEELNRIKREHDPNVTTWGRVWVGLFLGILSGLLLGLGIMAAANASK